MTHYDLHALKRYATNDYITYLECRVEELQKRINVYEAALEVRRLARRNPS